MIFNTNFKSLMLNSFVSDLGSSTNHDSFDYGVLAIYSGTMPTSYTEFESDWATKHFISSSTYGTSVLAHYGLTTGSSDSRYYVKLDKDTDGNFTLNVDNINDMYTRYVRDGLATFAVYYPWWTYYPTSTTSPNANNYFICTISDGTGNGIVQLDDTTIIGSTPVLSSFGFSFSAGGE